MRCDFSEGKAIIQKLADYGVESINIFVRASWGKKMRFLLKIDKPWILSPIVLKYYSSKGQPLLTRAIIEEDEKIFDILLKHQEDIYELETISECGSTPLHAAAGEIDPKYLLKILQSREKVNLEVRNFNGYTPLMFAYVEVAKILIAKGADCNARNNKGITRLHLALQRLDSEMVQLLVHSNADLTIIDPDGRSLLHYATSNPLTTLSFLLESPALKGLINHRDNKGYTALHLAVYNYCRDRVPLLLKAGADPSLLTNSGESLLHLAAARKSYSIDELLIWYPEDQDRKELLNTCDNRGIPPLFYSLIPPSYKEEDQIRDSKSLIDNGADIHFRVSGNNTFLHELMKCDNLRRYGPSVIKFLLEQGLSPFDENDNQETPYTIAKEKGLKNILELFDKYQKSL